jgi:hypothetical protein
MLTISNGPVWYSGTLSHVRLMPGELQTLNDRYGERRVKKTLTGLRKKWFDKHLDAKAGSMAVLRNCANIVQFIEVTRLAQG